jgi:hypothetical protein
MNKLVDEAPYHPGYEDAVIEPAFMYKGVDPAKMIWKPKPLTEEEILDLFQFAINWEDEAIEFARAIEQKHGIK